MNLKLGTMLYIKEENRLGMIFLKNKLKTDNKLDPQWIYTVEWFDGDIRNGVLFSNSIYLQRYRNAYIDLKRQIKNE